MLLTRMPYFLSDSASEEDLNSSELSEEQSSLSDFDSGDEAPNGTEEPKPKIASIKKQSITLEKEEISKIDEYKTYHSELSEVEKLSLLREQFVHFIEMRIGDPDLAGSLTERSPPDELLNSFLRQYGDQPVTFQDELTAFRLNLEKLLKVTVKQDSYDRAAFKSDVVDETLHNLITFKYELQ